MSLTKTRRAAGRSGTNSRKVGRNPTARQRQTPRFAAANCFVVFFVVWQCGLDDVELATVSMSIRVKRNKGRCVA